MKKLHLEKESLGLFKKLILNIDANFYDLKRKITFNEKTLIDKFKSSYKLLFIHSLEVETKKFKILLSDIIKNFSFSLECVDFIIELGLSELLDKILIDFENLL